MATEAEKKSDSKLLYRVLTNKLQIQKITHPETYAGAYELGEEMRGALIDLSGEDNFPPLPTLDPPVKT